MKKIAYTSILSAVLYVQACAMQQSAQSLVHQDTQQHEKSEDVLKKVTQVLQLIRQIEGKNGDSLAFQRSVILSKAELGEDSFLKLIAPRVDPRLKKGDEESLFAQAYNNSRTPGWLEATKRIVDSGLCAFVYKKSDPTQEKFPFLDFAMAGTVMRLIFSFGERDGKLVILPDTISAEDMDQWQVA